MTTPTQNPDPPRVDVERIRTRRQPLDAALAEAGAVFHAGGVYCPFHDDSRPGGSPSGSVFCGDDGVWRFRCHSCGVLEDAIGVQARANNTDSAGVLRQLSGRDRPRPATGKAPRVFAGVAELLASVATFAKVEAHYAYTRPGTGEVDLLVVRCRDGKGGKSFLQASPAPSGTGLWMKRPPGPMPLFNRTRVAAAERVVVCEGEKCVLALHAAGVVATTSPMGAGKASHADWSPLAGKAEVVLWPDHDEHGHGHMRDVADLLAKLSPPPGRVLLIDPVRLKLGDREDAADFVARIREIAGPDGADDAAREAVETALSRAAPVGPTGPAGKVLRMIEATIAGTRAAVPFGPWRELSRYTQALMPGMVSVICGGGGSTKTYLLLDACRHWFHQGVPFALQALEEHEDGTHLMRLLVQESGCTDLLKLKWIAENPDDAREAGHRHTEFLQAIGPSLWAVPGHIPTLAELTDWVRDRAKEGRRVVAIDPITAAETSERPWADDKAFVRNTQNIMRAHNASLLVVTHPRKGGGKPGGKPSMDDLSGGAAYQRHTQTVLWLHSYPAPKTVRCRQRLAGQAVVEQVKINRSLKIEKATNGTGTGQSVGLWLGDGMRFTEHGVILRKGQQ